jgi:arylformamidase
VDLFRAGSGSRLLVFIHGGYWRALAKEEFSWLGPPYVRAGCSVAVVGYRLCPEVSVGEIVEDCQAGVAAVASALRRPGVPLAVVLSGHSAGGHLAAMLLTQPASALGLMRGELRSALSISGLMDLAPLMDCTVNQDLRLDADGARRWSPIHLARAVPTPLLSAVGGDESPAFLRQARCILEAWPDRTEYLALAGANHFTAVDHLADSGGPLGQWVLRA